MSEKRYTADIVSSELVAQAMYSRRPKETPAQFEARARKSARAKLGEAIAGYLRNYEGARVSNLREEWTINTSTIYWHATLDAWDADLEDE